MEGMLNEPPPLQANLCRICNNNPIVRGAIGYCAGCIETQEICLRPSCDKQVGVTSVFCGRVCSKAASREARYTDDLQGAWNRKDDNLWAKHKILTEDFCRILYDVQGGVCPVCPKPNYAPSIYDMLLGVEKFWVVDHDHSCCPPQLRGTQLQTISCGQCIRGIICSPCNIALVAKWQDEAWARSAWAYMGYECGT